MSKKSTVTSTTKKSPTPKKNSSKSKLVTSEEEVTVMAAPIYAIHNVILVLRCTMTQIAESRMAAYSDSDKTVTFATPQVSGPGSAGLSVNNSSASCSRELAHTYPRNEDYRYKLRNLKIHMYTQNKTAYAASSAKQSDCFWCTCPFDVDACHILKYGQNGEICGRGAYCSPECACAGLFSNSGIDESEKYDSYQLMNYCYRRVDDGVAEDISIRPAPSPHYILDKFLGNMTAEEFRAMNRKSEHLLYMLDRPITRVMPEIHEERDGGSIIGCPPFSGSGKYKVKRQSEHVQSVNLSEILRLQFSGGM